MRAPARLFCIVCERCVWMCFMFAFWDNADPWVFSRENMINRIHWENYREPQHISSCFWSAVGRSGYTYGIEGVEQLSIKSKRICVPMSNILCIHYICNSISQVYVIKINCEYFFYVFFTRYDKYTCVCGVRNGFSVVVICVHFDETIWIHHHSALRQRFCLRNFISSHYLHCKQHVLRFDSPLTSPASLPRRVHHLKN